MYYKYCLNLKKKSIKNIFYKNLFKIPAFSFFSLKLNLLNKNKTYYIFNKSLNLIPTFNNLKFFIHNGKLWKLIIIKKKFIGFKLGEFIFTRRFGKGELIHFKKKKIKNKK